jgi:hypothetical protein
MGTNDRFQNISVTWNGKKLILDVPANKEFVDAYLPHDATHLVTCPYYPVPYKSFHNDDFPPAPFWDYEATTNEVRQPTKVEINKLWWPNGPLRWGQMWAYMDGKSLQGIVPGEYQHLIIRDENLTGSDAEIFNFFMRPLRSRPIHQADAGSLALNLELICFVDARYEFQNIPFSSVDLTTAPTWQSVLDGINGSIEAYLDGAFKIELGEPGGGTDEFAAEYLNPNQSWLVAREGGTIAQVLEVLARSTGRILVADTANGGFRLKTIKDEIKQLNDRLSLIGSTTLVGLPPFPAAQEIPSAISISFPKSKDLGQICGAWRELLQNTQALALGPADSGYEVGGNQILAERVHQIHTSAYADFTGLDPDVDPPVNIAAIDGLGEALARDWADLTLFGNYDYSIPGIGLRAVGTDDVVEYCLGYMADGQYTIQTRYRGYPINQRMTMLAHEDTSFVVYFGKIRFELTENVGATTADVAAAVRVPYDGSTPVDVMEVTDPQGIFAEGVAGTRGYALRFCDRWEIIQLECPP